jgi:hypothetical protein
MESQERARESLKCPMESQERARESLKCPMESLSSAMKNDRLSSLGLMHIHRDFEVDLYKAMEVFVSARITRGVDEA